MAKPKPRKYERICNRLRREGRLDELSVAETAHEKAIADGSTAGEACRAVEDAFRLSEVTAVLANDDGAGCGAPVPDSTASMDVNKSSYEKLAKAVGRDKATALLKTKVLKFFTDKRDKIRELKTIIAGLKTTVTGLKMTVAGLKSNIVHLQMNNVMKDAVIKEQAEELGALRNELASGGENQMELDDEMDWTYSVDSAGEDDLVEE